MQHANDIKIASQIGVNLLGFDFIPQSPRYVKMISSQAGIIPDFSVERLRALSQQTNTPQPQPITISRVGVFADDMPQNIVTRVYNYALDYVQLNEAEMQVASDGNSPLNQLLSAYLGTTPFLISKPNAPFDTLLIRSISHPQFAGINIDTQFELEPGKKDMASLQKYVEAIKDI